MAHTEGAAATSHRPIVNPVPPLDSWCSSISSSFFLSRPRLLALLQPLHKQIQQYYDTINAQNYSPTVVPPPSSPRPPRVFLLHGPSGVGKSHLTRLVSSTSRLANVHQISAASLFSKYHGESERMLSALFQKAFARGPGFVILDDMDALAYRASETHDSNEDAHTQQEEEHDDKEIEKRVMRELRSLLRLVRHDALDPRFPPLFVFLVCSRVAQLDESLDEQYIDSTIELTTLNTEERRDFFMHLTEHFPIAGPPSDRSSLLTVVSSHCHGYVGADLIALAREVIMRKTRHAQRRDGEALVVEPLELSDFLSAISVHRPANLNALEYRLNEQQDKHPNISKQLHPSYKPFLAPPPSLSSFPSSFLDYFSSCIGFESIFPELYRALLLPVYDFDEYQRRSRTASRRFPNGVLFTGPPGCCKTTLAIALARSTRFNVLNVTGSALLQSYVGESEKSIKRLFDRARQSAPTVIVIDQIETIAIRRAGMTAGAVGEQADHVADRLLSALLIEMDGLAHKQRDAINKGYYETLDQFHAGRVVVIATTSTPQALDPAILRPGRLDLHYALNKPDNEQRFRILLKATEPMPIQVDPDHERLHEQLQRRGHEVPASVAENADPVVRFLYYLAHRSEGLTGADLFGMAREAAFVALRRDPSCVSVCSRDFLVAFRVSSLDLEFERAHPVLPMEQFELKLFPEIDRIQQAFNGMNINQS